MVTTLPWAELYNTFYDFFPQIFNLNLYTFAMPLMVVAPDQSHCLVQSPNLPVDGEAALAVIMQGFMKGTVVAFALEIFLWEQRATSQPSPAADPLAREEQHSSPPKPPDPPSSRPALLIHTFIHIVWSSPRQGAASPDSLEKQKEDPAPSFVLQGLFAQGRNRRHLAQAPALLGSSRGDEVCSPTKHSCSRVPTARRAKSGSQWVKPWTASLPAAASELPQIFPSHLSSDPGHGTAATEPLLLSQHQQSHHGVQDKSPSSGHFPRIGAGVKSCKSQPVTLLSISHLQT